MSHQIVFDRKKHALSILDRMEENVQEQHLCDFIIKVGFKEVKAHRLVLSAASNYFRSMFKSGMKESKTGFVDMLDVDFECVTLCVDFMYNKTVTIPVEKYEDLMYVANMMQLGDFCDYIYATLCEKLDSELFFTTKRIADTYECVDLKEKCIKFAEENFLSISKENEFRCLDLEYIHKIITSKNAKMTEEEKLKVILGVVKVDSTRKKQLAEMIGWVNLGDVPLARREYIMKNVRLVCDNFEVYKKFTDSLLHELKLKHVDLTAEEDADYQSQNFSDLVVPPYFLGGQNVRSSDSQTELSIAYARHYETAPLKSANVLFDQTSEHLIHFNPQDKTMTRMKQMLGRMMGSYDYSAVAVDDHICVLFEDRSVYSFEFSYSTSPWEQMPDMFFHHGPLPPVTVSMDCLFVCGGSCGAIIAESEKFDLIGWKWEKLPDKPRACSDSAILAYNGDCYCFGGKVVDGATSIVEKFNVELSTWTEVAPMKYARDAAAAAEANGNIFVLGGQDDLAPLEVVEKYCVASNQWTEIKPMRIVRCWFRAFAIDGRIYCVGGSGADAADKRIDIYQTERNEWEVVELCSARGKLEVCDSVEIKI